VRRVTAYDASEWSDLFVATAGASAALAGLLFVAVSINIDRILEFPSLPERALETVLLLLAVLLVSVVGLIPGQGEVPFGLELLAIAVAVGGKILSLPTNPSDPEGESRSHLRFRWAIRIAATAPLALGGASVLIGSGGGLYWVAAAIVFALVGAIANAWVLLVEILR
jgi:modulator of FtsH protease